MPFGAFSGGMPFARAWVAGGRISYQTRWECAYQGQRTHGLGNAVVGWSAILLLQSHASWRLW